MGKSKFISFILSAFPGLGHFYLGQTNRGMVVMAAFFGWIGLVALACVVTGSNDFLVLLILLPIIWLYSLFDALQLCGRLQAGETVPDCSPLSELGNSIAGSNKNTLLALLFSIVPGAGHMYLGWQQRGLGFMSTFFLAMFLMEWLHLSLFFFMLPVVWLYSFFDTLKLVSAYDSTVSESEGTLLFWLAERQRWAGLVLIALGVLIIFERIVFPYLSYQLVNIIKTGLIAAIFIGGGLRLALGSKINLPVTSDLMTNVVPDNEIGEGERCNEMEKPSDNGE
jgi:TM2 domain-containing membrane protein YozV